MGIIQSLSFQAPIAQVGAVEAPIAQAGLQHGRISPALLLWLVAGFAGAAGLAIGLSGGAAPIDTELVPLLRFMAVIKACMAIGAAGLVHWRLRRPAELPLLAPLFGSTALMMVAPGLIWGLKNLILGAVLFHAGLIAFLIAAARDGFAKPRKGLPF